MTICTQFHEKKQTNKQMHAITNEYSDNNSNNNLKKHQHQQQQQQK